MDTLSIPNIQQYTFQVLVKTSFVLNIILNKKNAKKFAFHNCKWIIDY